MNSKRLLSFIFLSLILGCGVKAKPITPPEIAIKSYIDSYLDTSPPLIIQKKK